MASPKYFEYFKNIKYAVSANKSGQTNNINIKDYFNLARVREDIFKEDTLYNEYYVKNGERPDQISYEMYGTEAFYWVILQVNDIVDYYNEWPLSQTELNEFILKKYDGVEGAESIHHYETVETLDLNKNLVMPGGMVVPEDFQYFYPSDTANSVYLSTTPVGITNSDYEQRLNEKKSKIQIVQPKYIHDYVRETRLFAKGTDDQKSSIDISDVM